ncbi:MAG: glyoxalase [Xanthomonadales bacterium]|jgi:hypothetical protein|nr:glyoxalase [Xanthomonadales bacterium]
MDRPIFHLSFPVLDLDAAKAFYCDVLGATVGRDNANWADIILFGHQITLHHRPSEVLSPAQRGVRHFGAILAWQDWVTLGEKLRHEGCAFLRPPIISNPGTAQENGKMLLCDPSDNIIELKAYRNVWAVLGTQHQSTEA